MIPPILLFDFYITVIVLDYNIYYFQHFVKINFPFLIPFLSYFIFICISFCIEYHIFYNYYMFYLMRIVQNIQFNIIIDYLRITTSGIRFN